MGHVNPRLLALAVPGVASAREKHNCDVCTRGKLHKFPHSGVRPTQAEMPWLPGEYISCDLFGPLAKSNGGARYAAFYVDHRSKFVYVKPLASKDEQYVAFEEVVNDLAARSGRALRFFKSDGDGIFTGAKALALYDKFKIRHIQSAPGDSASNDLAERTIRTFAELTTTNLLHAKASAGFWAEAMHMLEYVWNHIPVLPGGADGGYLSRTSLLEGTRRIYDLSVCRAFGTKCHYLLTLQKKGGKKMAFHEKGRLGVIMGIEGNMPAYRVMDLETRELHRIPFAQTVSHEGHFPLGDKADGSDEGPMAYLDEDAIDLVPWRLFHTRPTASAPTPAPKVTAPIPATPPSSAPTPPAPATIATPATPAPAAMPTTPALSSATAGTRMSLRGGDKPNYNPPAQKYRTRVNVAEEAEAPDVCDAANAHRCGDQCEDKYLSTIVCYVAKPSTATPSTAPKAIVPTDPSTKPPSIPAPRNRREALASPWWNGYYEAELVEMRSHAQNGTWRLVPRSEVPAGCTVLRDRWAYSDKLGPNGNIERFKARLTAMGCFQRPGVDYMETYASVMATRTFRILLQIYNSDAKNTMLHWDVSTAFVHAPRGARLHASSVWP